MRHENVYQEIFERTITKLAEKFNNGNIPDDSTFEDTCCCVLKEIAQENEITVCHLGKRKFPDITLKYEADGERIGVEVKLHTNGELLTTLGNSAYASTQESGLETIFLLFGNFERQPPEFIIKPYANCIKDIKPTHNPRYIIDMNCMTDFCEKQLGVTFDQLRIMSENDRITYVNTYIARTKYEELTATTEKNRLVAKGFVLFPEIFSSNQRIRYRRMSVWLFAQNILCRNVRDYISANGVAAVGAVGLEKIPRIFTSLSQRVTLFKDEIEKTPTEILKNSWTGYGNVDEVSDSVDRRISLWLDLVSGQYGGGQKVIPSTSYKFRETLEKIFGV